MFRYKENIEVSNNIMMLTKIAKIEEIIIIIIIINEITLAVTDEFLFLYGLNIIHTT